MPRTHSTDTSREQKLRKLLEGQRHRIVESVRVTMREGRSEGTAEHDEVHDEAERSEADIQDDLELALLQMRSETLARIDEALERLDAGDYGRCVECAADISAARLNALPFAIRCRSCEQTYETGAKGHDHVSKWQTPVRLLDLAG
jgi:DnaK suppressor protein